MCTKRLMITGASGFVGRLLFRHLSTQAPRKFDVYGMDITRDLSPRYQQEKYEETGSPITLPEDRLVQCDITDRQTLHRVLAELRIDIVIHLAALLETTADTKEVLRVNVDGTRNVFEARQSNSLEMHPHPPLCILLAGVQSVLYASSLMIMHGYSMREPYASIVAQILDDSVPLRKLTVLDDPPLCDSFPPSCDAYCKSKVLGEQIARETRDKNSICARLGWVNTRDNPGKGWASTVWCSHRDFCNFVDKALDSLVQGRGGTYFVCSNNYQVWLDMEDAKKDLGFVPTDGAVNA